MEACVQATLSLLPPPGPQCLAEHASLSACLAPLMDGESRISTNLFYISIHGHPYRNYMLTQGCHDDVFKANIQLDNTSVYYTCLSEFLPPLCVSVASQIPRILLFDGPVVTARPNHADGVCCEHDCVRRSVHAARRLRGLLHRGIQHGHGGVQGTSSTLIFVGFYSCAHSQPRLTVRCRRIQARALWTRRAPPSLPLNRCGVCRAPFPSDPVTSLLILHTYTPISPP